MKHSRQSKVVSKGVTLLHWKGRAQGYKAQLHESARDRVPTAQSLRSGEAGSVSWGNPGFSQTLGMYIYIYVCIYIYICMYVCR